LIEAILSTRCVCGEHGTDFVTHAPKHSQLFFLGAGGIRGIIEGKVVAVDLPGENRAGLIGVFMKS
jgi:hypothetical protein